MFTSLEKRNSYTSKSILSVLQTTTTVQRDSKPVPIVYIVPSIVLIITSLVSLWAVLFYFVLGLCYYFQSGILYEDLNRPRLRSLTDPSLFIATISKEYHQLAYHCFFSFGLYLIIFSSCLFVLLIRRSTPLPYQDPRLWSHRVVGEDVDNRFVWGYSMISLTPWLTIRWSRVSHRTESFPRHDRLLDTRRELRDWW